MPDAQTIMEVLLPIFKAKTCSAGDMKAAHDAFVAADVDLVGDLGADEAAATARIAAVLAKAKVVKPAHDAIAQALLAAWKVEHFAAGKDPTKSPAAAGTIAAVLAGVAGCTADEQAKALAPFMAAKVSTIAEIGTDVAAAGVRIAELLGKSGLPKDKTDAIAKALVIAFAAVKVPEKSPGTSTNPPPSTSVPVGAIDLTSINFPTLSAETSATIAAFTVPPFLVTASDPTDPGMAAHDLQPWQWIHVAQGNDLTRCLHLGKLFASGDTGQDVPTVFADRAALFWELRDGAVINADDKTNTGSTVAVSVEQDRAYQQVIANASLAANYAFCSGSVKAAYKSQTLNSQYSKTVITRARWLVPRAELVMGNCLRVAPIFQHLVDVMLGNGMIAPELKVAKEDCFDFLDQLLDQFGHVFPRYVWLGGLLEIEQELVSRETLSADDIAKSLDTAVSIAANPPPPGTPPPTGGSLIVGYASDGTGIRTQANCFQNLHIRPIGGDRDGSDPAKWRLATKDPNNWRVIRREGILPVTSLLSDAERDAINRIVQARLRRAWTAAGVAELVAADGDAFQVPGLDPPTDFAGDVNSAAGYAPPAQPLLPYFPAGTTVTLRNQYWSAQLQDEYLRARNDVDATPHADARTDSNQDFKGLTVQPGDPLRVQGQFYTDCQPAPLRAPHSAGTDPKGENLEWTIVYTGRQLSSEEVNVKQPIFWLVTQDGKWALSGFKHMTGPTDASALTFASLFPYENAKAMRGDSPATWVLRPAVPPGRLKLPALTDDGSGCFRLYNIHFQSYLADFAKFRVRHYWTKHEPGEWVALGPPTGGHTWVPPEDVPESDPDVDIWRVMLRKDDMAQDFGSCYDILDHRFDTDKETAQKTTFMSRTWLIEPVSAMPERKSFKALSNDYITSWQAEHEAGLKSIKS